MTPLAILRVRALAGALLALLLLTMAAPAALATDEPAEPTETVIEEPSGPQPAVVLEEAGAVIEDQAWTFRYLVPTLLALAVVVVGLTLFVYAVRIRGRYRVVR